MGDEYSPNTHSYFGIHVGDSDGRLVLGRVLTHAHLNITMISVVWTYATIVNNFQINHKFTKYLKQSCGLDYGHHFPFKEI